MVVKIDGVRFLLPFSKNCKMDLYSGVWVNFKKQVLGQYISKGPLGVFSPIKVSITIEKVMHDSLQNFLMLSLSVGEQAFSSHVRNQSHKDRATTDKLEHLCGWDPLRDTQQHVLYILIYFIVPELCHFCKPPLSLSAPF